MSGSEEVGDLRIGRNSDQQKYDRAQYIVQGNERHRRNIGASVFRIRFSVHDPPSAPQGTTPLNPAFKTLEHNRVNVVLNPAKT